MQPSIWWCSVYVKISSHYSNRFLTSFLKIDNQTGLNFHVANISCCWEGSLIFRQGIPFQLPQSLLQSTASLTLTHNVNCYLSFYPWPILLPLYYFSDLLGIWVYDSRLILLDHLHESGRKIIQSAPKLEIMYFENAPRHRNIFHAFIN